MKLLRPILAVLFIKTFFCINLDPQNSAEPKILPNYVCKVTKDILKSTTDTQDVLIGNLGGKFQAKIVNDIAGCLSGADNAVVLTDLKDKMTEKTLRKAAVVILVFDDVEQNRITSVISRHLSSSVFHHMTKIVCIINGSIPEAQKVAVLRRFLSLSCLNVALVNENAANSLEILIFNSLRFNLIKFIGSPSSEVIFGDKLKDMQSFVYQIYVYNQPPRVIAKNKLVHSHLVNFLRLVAAKQNAKYVLKILQNPMDIEHVWHSRQMHLTINTGAFLDSNYPKLLTYEENAYCALVPLSKKWSEFEFIFTRPFDKLTWLLILLTMVSSAVVWRCFKNRGAVDSPWLIPYGFFAMFIGQSVEFSRKNRLVLVILVQLNIFMIFILSSVYESVITSLMFQSVRENRFDTFDELFASKCTLFTTEAFTRSIKNVANFEALKDRLDTTNKAWEDVFANGTYAAIGKCDLIEFLMRKGLPDGYRPDEHYYLLPEKILKYYERLEASYLNPFLERLQMLMDLAFEAGLPQLWMISMMNRDLRNGESISAGYLTFEDLIIVFSVYIVGSLLSVLVLLMEVLFDSCLKPLRFGFWMKKRHERCFGDRKNKVKRLQRNRLNINSQSVRK